MNRDFWYGVVFHLEERAKGALEEAADELGTNNQLLRAQILVDLSGAIRAGLDRDQERANYRRADR